MKVKLVFDRKDIGLYLALGIAGAGIGLVLGTVISTILKNREEDENTDGEDVIAYSDVVEELESWAAPAKRVGQAPRTQKKEEVEEEEDWPEELSAMQIELIKSGIITLEEALTAVNEEVAKAVADYSAPYQKTEKPPLDQLVEDDRVPRPDGLIEDRWVLFGPEAYDEAEDERDKEMDELREMRIVYSRERDVFEYTSARGNPVETSDISRWCSPGVFALVLEMLEEGSQLAWAEDWEKNILLRFELKGEDMLGGMSAESE